MVLVLFDDDYAPIEIYHASSEDVEQALAMRPDSQRKKRGAMSVAQFKIIGTLVWTQEDGLDTEMWDNHSS